MIATKLSVAGMETGDHPLNSPGKVVVGFHTDDKDFRSVSHHQFASLRTRPR